MYPFFRGDVWRRWWGYCVVFMFVDFVEDGVCTALWVFINNANCFSNDMVGGQVLFPSFRKFTWEISALFGSALGL